MFLHDPRCSSASAKSITRLKNKNKDDCVADSLYWPAMPRAMVLQYPETDRKKGQYPTYDAVDPEPQPHTVQPYCVPVPQNDQYHMHDAAVYSMWMHFVDFCLANASPCHHPDSAMCYAAVDVPVNPYARSKRLPVFRQLCNGQHLTPAVSQVNRYAALHNQQVAPLPLPHAPQQAHHQLHQHQQQQHVSLNLDPEYLPTANHAAPHPPRSVFDVFASAPQYSTAAPSHSAPGPAAHPKTAVPTAFAPISSSVSPASTVIAPASVAAPGTSPDSPAVLTRRNSAGSPVSVTDQLQTAGLGLDSLADLCEDGLTDSSAASAVWSADNCRLQKQNLPQHLVSPLLMPSLF